MNQARKDLQRRRTQGISVDLASEPHGVVIREKNLMKSWSDLDRTEDHLTATISRGLCHRLLRYHMNQILFAFLMASLSVPWGVIGGFSRELVKRSETEQTRKYLFPRCSKTQRPQMMRENSLSIFTIVVTK